MPQPGDEQNASRRYSSSVSSVQAQPSDSAPKLDARQRARLACVRSRLKAKQENQKRKDRIAQLEKELIQQQQQCSMYRRTLDAIMRSKSETSASQLPNAPVLIGKATLTPATLTPAPVTPDKLPFTAPARQAAAHEPTKMLDDACTLLLSNQRLTLAPPQPRTKEGATTLAANANRLHENSEGAPVFDSHMLPSKSKGMALGEYFQRADLRQQCPSRVPSQRDVAPSGAADRGQWRPPGSQARAVGEPACIVCSSVPLEQAHLQPVSRGLSAGPLAGAPLPMLGLQGGDDRAQRLRYVVLRPAATAHMQHSNRAYTLPQIWPATKPTAAWNRTSLPCTIMGDALLRNVAQPDPHIHRLNPTPFPHVRYPRVAAPPSAPAATAYSLRVQTPRTTSRPFAMGSVGLGGTPTRMTSGPTNSEREQRVLTGEMLLIPEPTFADEMFCPEPATTGALLSLEPDTTGSMFYLEPATTEGMLCSAPTMTSERFCPEPATTERMICSVPASIEQVFWDAPTANSMLLPLEATLITNSQPDGLLELPGHGAVPAETTMSSVASPQDFGNEFVAMQTPEAVDLSCLDIPAERT